MIRDDAIIQMLNPRQGGEYRADLFMRGATGSLVWLFAAVTVGCIVGEDGLALYFYGSLVLVVASIVGLRIQAALRTSATSRLEESVDPASLKNHLKKSLLCIRPEETKRFFRLFAREMITHGMMGRIVIVLESLPRLALPDLEIPFEPLPLKEVHKFSRIVDDQGTDDTSGDERDETATNGYLRLLTSPAIIMLTGWSLFLLLAFSSRFQTVFFQSTSMVVVFGTASLLLLAVLIYRKLFRLVNGMSCPAVWCCVIRVGAAASGKCVCSTGGVRF